MSQGLVSQSASIKDVLPPLAIAQLMWQCNGGSANAAQALRAMEVVELPPPDMEDLAFDPAQERSELPRPRAAENLKGSSFYLYLLNKEVSFKGYEARPVGLPIYHATYERERQVEGAPCAMALAFAMVFRCDPIEGAGRTGSVNMLVLAHFEFSGSFPREISGVQLFGKDSTLNVALATDASVEQLVEMGRALDARTNAKIPACERLLGSIPLTPRLPLLLNPAYWERQEIASSVGAASAPGRKKAM